MKGEYKITLHANEEYFVQLLRRYPALGSFAADWGGEVQLVAAMSDEQLRKYRFRYVDDDVLIARFDGESACEDCDAPTRIEADLNVRECAVADGVFDVRCRRANEVTYALQVLTLCDLMLRGIWGD